jgi:hypothetical protein
MKTSLSALLGGLIMLGGIGLAQAGTQADTVAPTKVQQTAAKSKLAIDQQGRAPGPLALTDAQMSELTAGHNRWWPHYGSYWKRSGATCYRTTGWHTGGTGC